MGTKPEPRWLISYTPGACLVLAGPTAVVALDPGPERGAGSIGDPVAELWQHLHRGISVRDVVEQLTRTDLGRLPRLAVLFVDAAQDGAEGGGLRALLRGSVRVLSEAGQVIAHGEDVLTCQEVRLSGLNRFELDLGGSGEAPGESLPLVHGGVRAGRLRLVAGAPESDDAALPAPPTAVPTAVPTALPPDAPEPPLAVAPRPAPDPVEDTAPMPEPVPAPISAEVEEMENGDTELMAVVPPTPPTPPPPPPPTVARLRAPDGSSVDLDRPVLIGRAPSNAGFENAQPHLLTVLSPSQDISRTHVMVAPEGDEVVVTDLHSTNGTTLVRPGPVVDREPLPSGQSVTVEVGTVIELGDEVAILVDTVQ